MLESRALLCALAFCEVPESWDNLLAGAAAYAGIEDRGDTFAPDESWALGEAALDGGGAVRGVVTGVVTPVSRQAHRPIHECSALQRRCIRAWSEYKYRGRPSTLLERK